MSRINFKAICLILGVAFSASPYADTMSLSDQSGKLSVNRPAKGEKMENVESQFGEPNEIINAIGEPPIIRWIYRDFTVYFEHEYVIHTVVKKS